MIVCHRHRFIFVTTRKTAGTRIEAALAAFCADGDLVTSIAANGTARARANGTVALTRYRPADWLRMMVRGERARFDKHLSAAKIRHLVGGAIWDSYFKFCVERDPWEKAVALYDQRMRDSKQRPTLATFLADARPESLSNYPMYSIDGALAVDRVIRYEYLDTELEAVRNLLNLPEPIVLPADSSPTCHYSALLGPTERALIDAACAREIELFGYAFREVAPEDR
jgi:hypothetical protein